MITIIYYQIQYGRALARLQYVYTQKGFSQSLRTNENLYFQASSAKIKSDTTGNAGLNLKSGDIIGLEKSYAEFLSLIYEHVKR